MFAKVINDEIVEYPYTMEALKRDNPNTIFFVPLHPEVKERYNIVDIHTIPAPATSWNQLVIEDQPVKRGGAWVQSWRVIDRPSEETISLGKDLRNEAYRNEADPLFFKAQRGEATMQQWLDKVEEIKQRFSY